MKKLVVLLITTISFFSCSSSDDNSNSDDNVFFTFSFDNKNYSSDVDGGLLCMIAIPNQSGSKVDILLNHSNPDDNTTTCGVVIGEINNGLGTTNNCTFNFISGGYYITCYNTKVVLTEVGDFYVGNFNGNINITDFNLYSKTIFGSGSFRVRKSI